MTISRLQERSRGRTGKKIHYKKNGKISFQEKEEKYPTVRKAEHIKMENINIYTLFWRIKNDQGGDEFFNVLFTGLNKGLTIQPCETCINQKKTHRIILPETIKYREEMRRVTILQIGLEKSFSPSNTLLLIGLIGRHQIWRVDEDDLYIQRKNYICTVMPFCIERRKSSFFDKGHNQRRCKRPSQECFGSALYQQAFRKRH